MTRTAFKLIRIGALAGPGLEAVINPGLTNAEKMVRIMRRYTGYNMVTGKMDWGSLAEGYGPYLGACLATYGIPKISGILRRL